MEGGGRSIWRDGEGYVDGGVGGKEEYEVYEDMVLAMLLVG